MLVALFGILIVCAVVGTKLGFRKSNSIASKNEKNELLLENNEGQIENFKHRKREIVFKKITGVVLGNEKYNETHISSSGGGGYVSQYGGHVRAPQISSTTTTNQEIWIKTEDGSEKSIKLKGYDIPMRPGHKITVISAGNKGADSHWYTVIVNHSTDKHSLLNNATALNNLLKIEQATGKSLLLAVLMFFSMLILSAVIYPKFLSTDASQQIIWGIPIGFFVYRVIVKINNVSDLRRNLSVYLKNLIQQAHQNT
jgi:hypothetical protein